LAASLCNFLDSFFADFLASFFDGFGLAPAVSMLIVTPVSLPFYNHFGILP